MALNYQCIIEYDGTNFKGFGKQPKLRTVQGEIEKALFSIFNTPINIVCAGRTDKGVHALGQSISFKAKEIDISKLTQRLNSILPDDISTKNIKIVPNSFDARKSSKSKTYLYIVYNAPYKSPFISNRSWHISTPLDLSKMQKAVKLLEHRMDFSAFDSYNSVFDYKIVNLSKVKICKKFNLFFFYITGDHFLYKMVRKIVGEIVRIGKGEQTIENFQKALLSKNRQMIGKPAKASGLYLRKITY